MGIKTKESWIKIKTLMRGKEEKKLLIEIDSINWYGTEYWLSVFFCFEGFKLINHEF